MSIKLELNKGAVKELLKSQEMQNCVSSLAASAAARAGAGYSSSTKQMGTRVVANAFTETKEAILDNMTITHY